MDAFTKFAKILALATAALCAAAAVAGSLWSALHAGYGIAGILLMSLNAFAAIGAFRLRLGIEPARLVLVSMVVRLVFLAAVMLLVIRFVQDGAALYSFVFSALAAYVVFQAVEIRHLLRNPGMLAK